MLLSKTQSNQDWHKQSVLLCLYIAQSIPMSFFSSVVPVIMREEQFSLESIGLLQFIKLPWILKLLWAPFIDNKTSGLTDYKRWIIGSEVFYAGVICCIALLSLETDFPLIIILMLISITASATQDIATDALSIRMIEKNKRSIGASMQSMGGFIGSLVGGGVLLVLYKQFGWSYLLCGLSVMVLIALIPLLLYKKPLSDTHAIKEKISLLDLFSFFKQKDIYKHILFLALYYSGILSILPMLRPYMVDLKYDVGEIGFIVGIAGTLTAVVCSGAAGLCIRRHGLKKYRPVGALLILLATVYVFILSLTEPSTLGIYLAVIFVWGAYGSATVAVYTTAMNIVRGKREGTDFTLQTVLVHFSGMIIAGTSGFIAGKMNYSGLFGFAVLLSLVSLLYNLFFYKDN